MIRHLLLSSAALAAAFASSSAWAQSAIVPPAPVSDADALAAQMRIIAAQPTDVGALAQAGELSTRLGDLSGAASLFARADKVDPRDGRVKAGMAEVLLRSERPGEALRFFDQAEGYGYPSARFAAERGLAYDLVGQQGRAQRDYRTVLATGDAPEVRRRYALSLAIAGQGEAALQELEPLIRRNDRGAWRSRAFVLAMQGDVTGATTIATTMMAPGQAQGLAPFFARLASLGPVDRAFAVHFGELRPTPQRIADARLAPALSPLAPETVQVARAAPVAPRVQPSDRRHRRPGTVQLAAAIPIPAPIARPPAYGAAASPATAGAVAASRPPIPPIAGAMPRPNDAAALAATAPAPRASAPKVAYYVPGSMLPRYYTPRPAPAAAGAGQPGAAATALAITPVPAPAPLVRTAPAPVVRTAPAPVVRTAPAPVVRTASALPAPVTTPATLAGVPPLRATASAAAIVPASPPPLAATPLPSPRPATVVASVTPPTTPPVTSPVATSSPVAMPVPVGAPAIVAATAAATVSSTAASDAVLAKIAEALAVPGRELAAAGAAEATPAPALAASLPTTKGSTDFPDTPLVVNGQLTAAGRAATARHRRGPDRVAAAPPASPAPTDAEPERPARADAHRPETVRPDRSTPHAARRALAAVDTAEPTPTPTPTPRPTPTPTPTRSRRQRAADKAAEAPTDAPTPVTPLPDRKALARKAAADRKALADRKADAEAKAQADRDAAQERKARKAEPERYWVQVAGGANESDLAKAWSSTKAKAPALAGRKGWSTPLRATNRVVTGPFKSDEEARAFVNTLKKQGVSAFPFTSEAGQKITRLDSK